MRKRHLFNATHVCLGAIPLPVGFCSLWQTLVPIIPQDPAKAFLLGFILGLGIALPGILFAISISPGEK